MVQNSIFTFFFKNCTDVRITERDRFIGIVASYQNYQYFLTIYSIRNKPIYFIMNASIVKLIWLILKIQKDELKENLYICV